MSPLSHLISWIPTKYYLYSANSFVTVTSDPGLYWHTHMHTRQATSFMFVFLSLGCYEGSFKYIGLFTHNMFVRWRFVSTSPNSHAGGTPLFGCPRLIIQYIRSHSLYLKAFSIRNPEDAPCRGDSNLIIASFLSIASCNPPRSYSTASGFKCRPWAR